MKTFWLALPTLTGCLSLDRPGTSFTEACRNLRVSPDDGVLSGNCNSSQKDGGIDTSVNLDGCLAWGDVAGGVNRLFPAEGGNFTDSCRSCSLIDPGLSPGQASFILCSCGPKGSDMKLGYKFDLSDIVSVGDSGRLQCLVGKDNVLGIPILNGDHALVGTIPDAVDWKDWLDQFDNAINTCEDSVTAPFRDSLLPKRFGNSSFEPCPNDTSLCCYFPPEHNGIVKEGFRLIEVGNYWYRFHFHSNPWGDGERYVHMSMIFRLCKQKERCPEGETPPAWDVPVAAANRSRPASISISSSSSRRITKALMSLSTLRRVVVQTVPILHMPTSTSRSDDDRQFTTVAEEKVARALPTSTGSRLVTGIPHLLFPTPPPTGSGCDQEPDNACAHSQSPEPAEHLIDGSRLDTEALSEIVLDVANPVSDITGTQDFNFTLLAGLVCPSEFGHNCALYYYLDATPPTHTISTEKFDAVSLGLLLYETIINKQDPHITVMLSLDLVCSAGSDSCRMEHVLVAEPMDAPKASLLASRATTDGSDNEHASVQERLSEHISKTTEVVIDLGKLDTSTLLQTMLEATNIEDVHHARIDLKVRADCESHRGSTECSNVVIVMSGKSLSDKTVDPSQPSMEPEPRTETQTKSEATRTKTSTNVETKNHARSSNVVQPALPTATVDTPGAAEPASTFTTAQRTAR